jgi:hypothetical protein
MTTDRRSFLRGLGALVAVALCKPVEAQAVPPRKLLTARPLLDMTAASLASAVSRWGHSGDQVFMTAARWEEMVRPRS